MRPYFPLAHGIPRRDDRKVISEIIHVIRNGLRWRDAPGDCGPYKTLYNRFVRWCRLGVFDRIFSSLSAKAGDPDIIQIDATHLKAHRAACSLAKRDVLRHIGRTKGGLNSELHAVVNSEGKPIVMALTAGQVSDHIGARIIYPGLPNAATLIGDKGYDSDELRTALKAKGIATCIAPRAKSKNPAEYSETMYKKRHKVENTFSKLKDWRRIATRYDRSADTFFSAITIAVTVIFWLM